jgi:hypothetical protein
MLTRFDDYPIHQTPEPIAHPATSDRNAYDRYFFNGYPRDGSFYFGAAMGLYPHRGILDGSFSVVRDGVQHSFHGSRRAPTEPTDTSVGPMRVEVLEPMRRSRVVVEPNDTGISCDLEFAARTGCVEEGRQTLRSGLRATYDVTRFAQFGTWRGEIDFAGERIEVDSSVYGSKDRSWGVRGVGEPDAGGAPRRQSPQFFFMWAPVNWEDRCTHFGVFEDGLANKWHQDGAIVPVHASPDQIVETADPETRVAASVEHRIDYEPGTRWARAAEIEIREPGGELHVIELEPLLRFQMKGIGYSHPEWGHGRWKGELEIGGESWKLADLDPLAFDNLHIQQVMRARQDDREGIGILEQICIGPHAPSGFTQIVDGAS